jgi:hypothetical protein
MPNRRALDRPLYDALVAAFRVHPDDFRAAGKMAGCDYRTARKTWISGWALKGTPWARPIRELMEAEQIAARAKLGQEAADSKVRVTQVAAEDAVTQKAEEAKLTRNVRNAASASLGVVAQAFPAAQELVKGFVEEVKAGKYRGDPNAALRAIGSFVNTVGRVASIASLAQQMERRRLGEPNDILAVQGMDAVDDALSLDDLDRELKAASNALIRAREMNVEPPKPTAPAANLAN